MKILHQLLTVPIVAAPIFTVDASAASASASASSSGPETPGEQDAWRISLSQLKSSLAIPNPNNGKQARWEEKHTPIKELNLNELLYQSQGILRISLHDDNDVHADETIKIGVQREKNINTHENNFVKLRHKALSSLCDCPAFEFSSPSLSTSSSPSSSSSLFQELLKSHPKDLQQIQLPDGSIRRTLGTATVGFDYDNDDDDNNGNNNSKDDGRVNKQASPLPLPPFVSTVCGQDAHDAMEDLRDVVSHVVDLFVDKLDYERSEKERKRQMMREVLPYEKMKRLEEGGARGNGDKSYREILSMTNHLEHFHVYSKEGGNIGSQGGSEEDSVGDGTRVFGKHNNDHENRKEYTITPTSTTLDYHIDAGFFLAFVPAMDCHSHSVDNTSFYLKGNDESTQSQKKLQQSPVEFQENEIVILMGAGAQYWLNGNGDHDAAETHANPFIAASHALRLLPDARRSWYGKMHLLPSSWMTSSSASSKTATPSTTTSTTQVKYGHVLPQFQLKHYQAHVPSSPVDGCGTSLFQSANTVQEIIAMNDSSTTSSVYQHQIKRRRLQHVGSPANCNNQTNFFCWYQCVDIPNNDHILDYLRDGYSLYCLDPAILSSSENSVPEATDPCMGGYTHNSACMGSWQPTDVEVDGYYFPYYVPEPAVAEEEEGEKQVDETSSNVDEYHTDMGEQYCYGGTSMYMDGFHWIDTTCVIYLFPNWVLSTPVKFAWACIGSILFGVLLEYVLWKRRSVYALPPGYRRLLLSVLVYGVQLSMGYFIMLVIMTYSGPLFVSTVGGMMVGHILFNAQDSLVKMRMEKKERALEGDTCGGGVGLASLSTSRNSMTDRSARDETTSESYQNGNSNGGYHDSDDEAEMGGCCGMMSNSPKHKKVASDVVTEQTKLKDSVPEGATPCCQYTL